MCVMGFLGKYSNGWGHLIFSLVCIVFCVIVVLDNTADVTIKGLAVSVVTLLVGYWFGSGSKQPPTILD